VRREHALSLLEPYPGRADAGVTRLDTGEQPSQRWRLPAAPGRRARRL